MNTATVQVKHGEPPVAWLSMASGGFKGERWGRPPPPHWLRIFFQKAAFFRVKGIYCSSLCAFAINNDGTDDLSSAPASKFLNPPLGRLQAKVRDRGLGLRPRLYADPVCDAQRR